MAPTTWSRLEPSAATTDIEVGLAAAVADPLWMLARQRQLGEFRGDDGGTPVGIHLCVAWSELDRFHAGPLPRPVPAVDGQPAPEPVVVPAVPLDRTMPLEAVVESEPRRVTQGPGPVGWATRLRAGRRLEDRLRSEGLGEVVAALRRAFPFTAGSVNDAEGAVDRRYRRVLPGHATDGLAAFEALAAGPIPAAMLGAAADPLRLGDVVAAWRVTEAALLPSTEPVASPPSWLPERLEYAFAVAAPGFEDDAEIVLEAAEYDGTGVDWTIFDRRHGVSLEASVDGPKATRAVRHVLPQPVRYPGMPADRFWEMEDGRVDLGAVGAGPTDLARMLALEYAIVYGPNWFLAPLELPVGSVARVEWVVVRDTFGATVLAGTHVTQRDDAAGRQFQPSTTDAQTADVPLLVLPPAGGPTLRGRPVERLVVLRDELANLAWGIEHTVQGPAERPIAMRTAPTDDAAVAGPDPAQDAPKAELLWRLATPVPPGWLPLVAVNLAALPMVDLRLVAAQLLDTIEEPRKALGQLMSEIADLYEEEVGRAGVDLILVDQVTRRIDGSMVSWRGREKRPGRGEASAGLFFDRLERTDGGPSIHG